MKSKRNKQACPITTNYTNIFIYKPMKHIVTKPWLQNNANWHFDAKELWSSNPEALETRQQSRLLENLQQKKSRGELSYTNGNRLFSSKQSAGRTSQVGKGSSSTLLQTPFKTYKFLGTFIPYYHFFKIKKH